MVDGPRSSTIYRPPSRNAGVFSVATLEQVTSAQPRTDRTTKSWLTSGEWWWRALIWFILIGGATIMSLPFVWLVISSFKPQEKIFLFPPEWIPRPFLWQNYVEALVYKPFGLYIYNTLKIIALNLVAILLSASFCGYGFARIRFPGRDFWFGLVLATMMVPYFVLMVPQFIIFTRLGWIDTIWPLTFPFFFGGGAFNIFLLRQFFRTLPEELADAGRIDGCNEFGVYWKIMMPLC
jgi:multiple sugar transport system permease protein